MGSRWPVYSSAERVRADRGHRLVLVDAEADLALVAVANDAHGELAPSGPQEQGFEGQAGPEGEDDDPLAGLDLAAGQQLLEDEQHRGRGAVAAVGQRLAGPGELGVAEP